MHVIVVVQVPGFNRGGQGAKTAAAMVAEVAIGLGKYGQGYPDYGAERAGAPMKAYNRIARNQSERTARFTVPTL